MEVTYNPKIPIETFDVVTVDECHRSIYGVWRQAIEYFDAFLVGLTATPAEQTSGHVTRAATESGPRARLLPWNAWARSAETSGGAADALR